MTTTLKYIFTARFANGKTYYQQPEDKSIFEPEKRSAFFDVLEMEKESKLLEFMLEGAGHRYTVNLSDGHFEIDGVPFMMHEKELRDFKLVFFRRHTHTFRMSQEANRELSHLVVYRIGWQSVVDGVTYERVMQIE